jgi:hypothetical protein
MKQPKKERLGDYGHFLMNLGSALASWQLIESRLATIFCQAFEGTGDHTIPLAAFHSVNGIEIKMDMTDAAVHASAVSPELLAEWDKLLARMYRAKKKRNRLAHFAPIGTVDSVKGDAIFLAPNPSNTKEFMKSMNNRGPKYDWTDICVFGASFNRLSLDLLRYCGKFGPYRDQQIALMRRVAGQS